MEEICRQARAECVLVCCNTVGRAQAAYRLLRQRLAPVDIPVHLLQSRFAHRDRLVLENRIIAMGSAPHCSWIYWAKSGCRIRPREWKRN